MSYFESTFIDYETFQNLKSGDRLFRFADVKEKVIFFYITSIEGEDTEKVIHLLAESGIGEVSLNFYNCEGKYFLVTTSTI